MTARKYKRGFTLIELLVALIILSIISFAGYRGLNTILLTRERVAEESRKWQHLAYFFSRLELDIAQTLHRPVRELTGDTSPALIGHAVLSNKNDAQLTFTRTGVEDQGTEMLPPQRIAYRLENGAIVLLHWSRLDQTADAQPKRHPLLEGVAEFKLSYLGNNRIWETQWPPLTPGLELPYALRVDMKLTSGEQISRIFALQ